MSRPNTHAEINEFRLQSLIEATIKCIAAKGLEGATVRTIAAEAGVSRGLIGHYFTGRDALIVESHRHLCNVVEMRVMQKVSRPGLAVRDRLTLMAKVIFSTSIFNENNSKAFMAFWHATSNYKEIGKTQERLYNSYRKQATEQFTAANDAGANVLDPSQAAFSYIALIDGLWLQLTLEQRISRKQAVAACEQFVDLQLG